MNVRQRSGDLAEKIGQITQFSRAECISAWKKAFKTLPPKYLSIPFMQRVLAHDLQCRQWGGHSAAARRALRSVLANNGDDCAGPVLCDGSTLVREWNGRVYRVETTADGYVLDGKPYTSLSAVARHITGAHWSGPRFFGLTSPREA